jgi:single-stranded-DNA-specific exonuclease
MVNRGLDRNWAIKAAAPLEEVAMLSQSLQVHPALAELLTQRGINDVDDANFFFRPKFSYLHDPYLMRDMERAVDCINETILANEPILVFGDYDVDGTTSVSLLVSFLGSFYNKVGYYIPDRYHEGYGLSNFAIDYAVENGYKLIITLDCGITAFHEVEYANVNGVKVIISDHHLPNGDLPPAVAVLNPKRDDCPYPYKHLSGCGIGFKLAHAICIKNQFELAKINQLIDLAAVSIAADLVPITGENRILAYFGLKKLNTNPSLGLKVLIDNFVKNEEVSISDIVHSIGPRINAAGRLGDAKAAVRLLLANERAQAEEAAIVINNTNQERRDIDSSITEEALDFMDGNDTLQGKKSTVLYQESWHKGVIGIVASRLIEKYYKPTIVFTKTEDNKLTGSARSVKDFNIYQAISDCGEIVEQFGGHKYAAGLTIREEHFKLFRDRFESVVASSILEEQLVPKIEIDQVLNMSEITLKFVRTLKQFAPFGPGNPEPVFCSKGVYATGNIRVVGNNHLQLFVKQEMSNSFAAIAFNQGDHFEKIAKGIPFDMVYTVEENFWKGKSSIKLTIKDIKY